jgi:thioredoxin reductase (NADPH)
MAGAGGAGLRIVGSLSSPDARRLREFAARNRLPHVWVDLDADPVAGAVLGHHGLSPGDTPVVVMRGGEVLRNPSNTELARAAGFGADAVPGKTFDVAVVGAGPVGLAASVYGASESLATAPASQSCPAVRCGRWTAPGGSFEMVTGC